MTQFRTYTIRHSTITCGLQIKLPAFPPARIKLRLKTFKIKYFWAFGLKSQNTIKMKRDESTGVRPKKGKPTIPQLSRIKRTAFFIISLIILSNLSTIQFRLAFKDKRHKPLEYCCLVIHLTSVSTISYAESNGGIFILSAPLGITNCLVPRCYVLFYGLRGLCVGRVDQFDRFRRIFRFSPSRAVPRALNDVNKPKRLCTRQHYKYKDKPTASVK